MIINETKKLIKMYFEIRANCKIVEFQIYKILRCIIMDFIMMEYLHDILNVN